MKLSSGSIRFRDFGAHQLQFPTSFMLGGTSRPLTKVASTAMAKAIPKPTALTVMMSASANEPTTIIRVAAAPVIISPVLTKPLATGSVLSRVSR